MTTLIVASPEAFCPNNTRNLYSITEKVCILNNLDATGGGSSVLLRIMVFRKAVCTDGNRTELPLRVKLDWWAAEPVVMTNANPCTAME